jgi:hypothetical protein
MPVNGRSWGFNVSETRSPVVVVHPQTGDPSPFQANTARAGRAAFRRRKEAAAPACPTGIGSAAVVAVAVGQQGVEPRDAGTAGALTQVSQQLGAALGVALISTFVATATSHYRTHHGSTAVVGATVHGFTVGYWCAAGVFWAAAVICGALVRGGTSLRHEAGQPEPLDEIVDALI